jgi:hypothetical protein
MIWEIFCTILSVAVILISYYLSVKNKINSIAGDAINKAEDLSDIGEEKMKMVVAQVKTIIPPILRMAFNDEFLEQIVQELFDKMKKFAEKRAKKNASQ